MLLTITTTHRPATDLGYLLAKNPARVQSFALSFGQAHVFYPEASPERCTAALLLDVDPVALVRRRGSTAESGPLEQYVNDRPYVASSFLSVAIAEVFRTALGGRNKEMPELTQTPLPLVARLAVLPCRGGESLLQRLFEPLGYTVAATRYMLDERFPAWGDSPYYTVELTALIRLQDLLTHLYVLIPVLDDDKHYWVGDDEVAKLLHRGAGWLSTHPERDTIVKRYLKGRRSLMRDALARLVDDEIPDPESAAAEHDAEEAVVEERISLHQQRLEAVLAVLRALGARRVVDLGCGEGRLLRLLLEDSSFTHIAGMDVSYHSLEIAQERLHLDRLPPSQRDRITLLHGSLTYRDARLAGYDAAAVVEVIEHLDPPRLAAFERAVFGSARPGSIIITTPNSDYNVLFETLPAGAFRHRDHRFEWTRSQFQTWAGEVARHYNYSVRFASIGPDDPVHGPPSQMGVFTVNKE